MTIKLKHIGFFEAAKQFISIAALLTISLITKIIPLSEFSIYTLFITVEGVFIFFVFWTLPSGLLKFISGETDNRVISRDIITSIVITILSGFLWFLVVLPFKTSFSSLLFGDVKYQSLIFLVIIKATFSGCYLILINYFRISGQNRAYLKYNTALSFLRLICMISSVLISKSIFGLILTITVFDIFQSSLLFIVIFNKIKLCRPSFKLFKPYFTFCIPLLINNLSSWSLNLSDRFFLKYFLGVESVGIYDVIYKLCAMIQSVQATIFFLYTPSFYACWNNKNFDQFVREVRYACKLVMFYMIPATVFLSVAALPITSALFTSEIAQVSGQVVPYVCLAHIFNVFFGFGGQVFYCVGKSYKTSIFILFASLINIGLNILLIKFYGILGAAVSTALAYLFLGFITVHFSKQHIQYNFSWSTFIKYLVLSCTLGVYLHVTLSNNLLLLIPNIILALLGYLSVSSFFKICPFEISIEKLKALLR